MAGRLKDVAINHITQALHQTARSAVQFSASSLAQLSILSMTDTGARHKGRNRYCAYVSDEKSGWLNW
ncbi:MAG TPA: hypothetical protein ENF70_04945 [Deltaproteobacteria bacterium]|nr:hypothetical protein [Deltaproteobacteria bacterium]